MNQRHTSMYRFFLSFVLMVAVLFSSASGVFAQTHTHAQTCGTYNVPTGLRLVGADITKPIAEGTYTLAWDPVISVSGGSPGTPVTGRVWYHIDIDNLSTTTNPDFTKETPVYDRTPITTYSSYTFKAGQYRWTLYGRGGCGYGPAASVIITVGQTVVMGRVTDGAGKYWQTTSACGNTYTTSSGTTIKSERLDSNGNVVAIGSMSISSCNPLPYYSSGPVMPSRRKLTLVGIPAGYSCSDWSYSRYDKAQSKWIDVKTSSGGIFNKSTCSVTVDTMMLNEPYDNSHHIWFILASNITPTPTFTPTPTPIVTISPTITPPVTTCNIVPTDIEMVIDRSSSMWQNSVTDANGVTKTKLEWAKVAATKFVDEFSRTGAASRGIVRIGVTTFMGSLSGTTSTSYTPTTNFAQVKTWINSIPASSTGTCISCGISAAESSISKAGTNGGKTTRKVVVLLSDGRANRMITNADLNNDGSINSTDAGYEAINLANTSRLSSNYLYYVVGFGSSGSPVREWVLKGDHNATSSYPDTGISNEPASTYYRYDQDAFDWSTLFDKTQDNICSNPLLRAQ